MFEDKLKKKKTNIQHKQNTTPCDASVERFYLIWSTSGSFWHHVDISGFIVIHCQLTLGTRQVVGCPFTTDGLAPSDAEYRAALKIPTNKQTNKRETI